MKTTKLELSQLLAARNSELEAARLRIAELEGDVAALKARVTTPRPARPTYVAPPATDEQLKLRAAMAAAKELAMRTGRSVRVGE